MLCTVYLSGLLGDSEAYISLIKCMSEQVLRSTFEYTYTASLYTDKASESIDFHAQAKKISGTEVSLPEHCTVMCPTRSKHYIKKNRHVRWLHGMRDSC